MVFFITGSSRGIGLALKENLLSKAYQVFGLSRSTQQKEKNFAPISIDLSDEEQLENFVFPDLKEGVKDVFLINNAGTIGPVLKFQNQSITDIKTLFTLNLIAPSLLMRSFINKYDHLNINILNISSGAANNDIEAWSTYCSSKAALDRLSSVIKLERPDINLLSIAPGVVDTQMQEEIRNAKASEFPALNGFNSLKTTNQLKSPAEVAEKLIYFLLNPSESTSDRFSLREL